MPIFFDYFDAFTHAFRLSFDAFSLPPCFCHVFTYHYLSFHFAFSPLLFTIFCLPVFAARATRTRMPDFRMIRDGASVTRPLRRAASYF